MALLSGLRRPMQSRVCVLRLRAPWGAGVHGRAARSDIPPVRPHGGVQGLLRRGAAEQERVPHVQPTHRQCHRVLMSSSSPLVRAGPGKGRHQRAGAVLAESSDGIASNCVVLEGAAGCAHENRGSLQRAFHRIS